MRVRIFDLQKEQAAALTNDKARAAAFAAKGAQRHAAIGSRGTVDCATSFPQ